MATTKQKELEAQEGRTYFICWYNQDTKLQTTEDKKLQPCNILVNEYTNTIDIEVERPAGLSPTTISADKIRYVKPIQKNEVLFSWWDHAGSTESVSPTRFAWLTFKETEHTAVTSMVCLIQKLQMQARPDLSAILSFEGCGNIAASVGPSGKSAVPFDNYFFIVDKEVLVFFQTSLEEHSAAMHFYKEPGPHAIEQVLSRKDIGQCEIKTPSCALTFKLESVGANILLESIRKCRPLPQNIFKDEPSLRDYLAEVQVQHHMAAVNSKQRRGSGRGPSLGIQQSDLDSAVSMSNEYHFDHVINTLQVGYNGVSDDDQLTLMWAATEGDITEVIAKGLVPGSAIGSSGMDPDSYEHFAKCIDEIQDALFEESYGKAVSILRGTKKLFSECRFAIVKSFLKDQTDLEILKKVYFRDKQ